VGAVCAHLVLRAGPDAVGAGPPAVESRGEDLERALHRRLNEDASPDWDVGPIVDGPPSIRLGLVGFHAPLERRQGASPELIEIGAQRQEAVGVQLVDSPRAHGLVHDELRILKDPKVLRYRRPTHRERAGELADRKRAVEEPGDDRTSRWVPQRIELAIKVSIH
jgi:hypothetical protein